jgi:hypothetical protein
MTPELDSGFVSRRVDLCLSLGLVLVDRCQVPNVKPSPTLLVVLVVLVVLAAGPPPNICRAGCLTRSYPLRLLLSSRDRESTAGGFEERLARSE